MRACVCIVVVWVCLCSVLLIIILWLAECDKAPVKENFRPVVRGIESVLRVIPSRFPVPDVRVEGVVKSISFARVAFWK